MNNLKTSRPAMSKHLIGPNPKQQRKVLARILTTAQAEQKQKIDSVSVITWSIIITASVVGWSVVIYTLLHS